MLPAKMCHGALIIYLQGDLHVQLIRTAENADDHKSVTKHYIFIILVSKIGVLRCWIHVLGYEIVYSFPTGSKFKMPTNLY